MLKAVNFREVTLDVLQHIQEEASHAWMLKKLAARRGLGSRSWDQNPLSKIGWHYFHSLDNRISTFIDAGMGAEGIGTEGMGTEVGSYPAVSWAIETRALSVYRLYVKQTQDELVRKTVAAILAQEKRHESYFGKCNSERVLRDVVIEIEATCWGQFLESLLHIRDEALRLRTEKS